MKMSENRTPPPSLKSHNNNKNKKVLSWHYIIHPVSFFPSLLWSGCLRRTLPHIGYRLVNAVPPLECVYLLVSLNDPLGHVSPLFSGIGFNVVIGIVVCALHNLCCCFCFLSLLLRRLSTYDRRYEPVGRPASLRTAHPLRAITTMTQAIRRPTRPIVTVYMNMASSL